MNPQKLTYDKQPPKGSASGFFILQKQKTQLITTAKAGGKPPPVSFAVLLLNDFSAPEIKTKEQRKDPTYESPTYDYFGLDGKTVWVKIFNPNVPIIPGLVYRFEGGEVNVYKDIHSLQVTSLKIISDPFIIIHQSLTKIPFDRYKIKPEEHFLHNLEDPSTVLSVEDEETDQQQQTPSSTNSGNYFQFLMELKPQSYNLQQQPLNTIICQFLWENPTNVPNGVLTFKGSQPGAVEEFCIGGESNSDLILLVKQNEANDSSIIGQAATRIYKEDLESLQMKDWKVSGLNIVHHVQGYLNFTLDVQKTKYINTEPIPPNKFLWKGYSKLMIDVAKTIKNAGILIPFSLASSLLSLPEHRTPMYDLHRTANAVNLSTLRDAKFNEYLKDDPNFEYYVIIGTRNDNIEEITHIRDTLNQEQTQNDLKSCLMDKVKLSTYPFKKINVVNLDIYLCSKDDRLSVRDLMKGKGIITPSSHEEGGGAGVVPQDDETKLTEEQKKDLKRKNVKVLKDNLKKIKGDNE